MQQMLLLQVCKEVPTPVEVCNDVPEEVCVDKDVSVRTYEDKEECTDISYSKCSPVTLTYWSSVLDSAPRTKYKTKCTTEYVEDCTLSKY